MVIMVLNEDSFIKTPQATTESSGSDRIPLQLRNPRFRFVLVNKDKKAFEKGWTKGTDYKWNDLILTRHLDKDGEYGGAYGVLGGHGNLLIVDFDKQWMQDAAYPLLPETFTVKTARKGMYHLYYLIDGAVPKKTKIPDVPDGESGDLLGHGAQAVGPGSRVFIRGDDNGIIEERSYTVFRDAPIATVKLEQLQEIFTTCVKKRREEMGIPEEEEKPTDIEALVTRTNHIPNNLTEQQAAVIDEIKRINLREFLHNMCNVNFHDGINGAAECPFHDSERHRNLSINQSEQGHWIWYCHHGGCNRGGDIFTFVMEKYNLKFNEAVTKLAKFLGLTYPKPVNTIEDLNISPEQSEIQQIQTLSVTVNQQIMMGKKEIATELIKDYILQTHYIKTTKSDKLSEIWYYEPTEGIYKDSGASEIKRICCLVFDKGYTKRMAQFVIDKIEASTYIDRHEFFNKQNEYPELICIQNGILNIITEELTPFTPDIYFFNHLPVRYDPEKTCPKIIKFLRDILPLEENIKTIQELMGYILYKRYKYQKAFMFHGPGRNGKSQLLDLMKRLVGKDNFAAVSLKQIEDEGFSVINLHNKLVNLSSEITKNALENAGVFKKLVGWDEIQANRKFKEYINFQNYAKLIFATNELPRIGNMDEAFWRRWIMLKFPYRFLPEDEIMKMGITIDQAMEQGIRVQIPDIINSICNVDEMSGLLNWALEGFKRLRKQGNFTYSKGMDAMKNEWLCQSNSAHAFVSECIEYSPNEFVTLEEMRIQYYHFCEHYVVPRISAVEFNKHLSDKTTATQLPKRVDGSLIRVWNNIRLKKKYTDLPLDDN